MATRSLARRLGLEVRPDERRAVALAAALIALVSAAYALVASAGDALFVARVGARHVGTAFAASNLLLIATLGVAGALADRVDRGRMVVLVAVLAALVVGGLAMMLPVGGAAAPTAVMVLGKQLGAATELAFWVLVADRFDARQARRLVPVLVVVSGAGLAAGAFAVGPLVRALGAPSVLVVAAATYVVAAVVARGFARDGAKRAVARRAALAHAHTEAAPLSARALRAGWAAVSRSSLARALVIVVALAGMFAPILYYFLLAAASAEFASEDGVAQFLGQYRGGVQLLTLGAQAVIAPAILARGGVAFALLIAPAGAVVVAAALSAHASLAVVVVAQGATRLLDTAIQTPAERLVQNLMPRGVRGRVAGFVDGVAKRSGAIAGGAMAALLFAYHRWLGVVAVAVALAWGAAAIALRRRFAELAVAELSARRLGVDDVASGQLAASLGGDRALRKLAADLTGADPQRRERAVELVTALGRSGRAIAAMPLLARALAQAPASGRDAVVRAVDECADARVERAPGVLVDGLLAIAADRDGDAVTRGHALVAAARLATATRRRAQVGRAVAEMASDGDAIGVLAARAATANLAAGGDPAAGGAGGLARACTAAAAGGGPVAALAVRIARPALYAAVRDLRGDAAARWGRSLVRAVAADVDSATRARALVALARAAVAPLVELALLRADIVEVARERADHPDPGVRAAALSALAACRAGGELLARALTDDDERVRRSAADGLRALGSDALPLLLVSANFGRRGARNAALEILGDLRTPAATLDDLIERERRELHETVARLAPLTQLATERDTHLLARRLRERAREIGHTLLLILEARLDRPVIGDAARRFLSATDTNVRARALEALDALVPAALGRPVLDVLDDAPAATLSARAVDYLDSLDGEAVDPEDAVRAELQGVDPIARALLVHALGGRGRVAYRAEIRAAAAAALSSYDPMTLIRRIAGDPPARDATRDREEDEVPRSVETMMALSEVPLFAELTTRQLSALAELVDWEVVDSGVGVAAAGDVVSAMYLVGSGRVRVGDDGVIEPGGVFAQPALFEDYTLPSSIVVEARGRLGRIDRVRFEDLVEDEPGIALAICRVLGRASPAIG